MTPTDTSALRALRDTSKVNFVAALVSAAPDLLNELDQLRGQVARVEALRAYGWANGQQVATPQIRNALAIPAEGAEHVHLFESDGCITVGCATQVCAACGHIENPHIEGCKAAEGGE